MISDASYVPKDDYNNQNDKNSKNIFLNLLYKIPVFIPDSLYIILWKMLILLILSMYFFIIPLQFSFSEVKLSDDSWEFLFIIIPIPIFVSDILRCFNTGFYEDGVLISSRKRICYKYLKFHFSLDLLTTLSIIFTN